MEAMKGYKLITNGYTGRRLNNDVLQIIAKFCIVEPIYLASPIMTWKMTDLNDFFVLCGVHYKLPDALYGDHLVRDLHSPIVTFDPTLMVETSHQELDPAIKQVQTLQQQKHDKIQIEIEYIEKKLEQAKETPKLYKETVDELSFKLTQLTNLKNFKRKVIEETDVVLFKKVFLYVKRLMTAAIDRQLNDI